MTAYRYGNFSDYEILCRHFKDGPCIAADGTCYIVARIHVITDEDFFDIQSVRDVAVFDTETKAQRYVAAHYDSRAFLRVKDVYVVRIHQFGRPFASPKRRSSHATI